MRAYNMKTEDPSSTFFDDCLGEAACFSHSIPHNSIGIMCLADKDLVVLSCLFLCKTNGGDLGVSKNSVRDRAEVHFALFFAMSCIMPCQFGFLVSSVGKHRPSYSVADRPYMLFVSP